MSHTEHGASAGPPTVPTRLLCVDDDAEFLELVVAFLQREDPTIEVTATTSTEEGLATVARGVDCIVSDYDMPDCDGLDFLREVRRVDPAVPFILFTGKGSEEIAAEAISAGVTDYLQKSTSTEQYTLLANRITNLTEKHRAECQLAETVERYELVGRASADAFWDWNTETDHVWRSEGFTSAFGYDPSEIGDDREWGSERIHPDDRGPALETFEAFLDSGEPQYEDTFRFERRNGSYAHIVDRAYAVYDDPPAEPNGTRTDCGRQPSAGTASAGRPRRVVGAITDISPLVERETELERSQRLYRTLIESFPEAGVFLFDSALRYTVAGGEMLAYHGCTPAEFVERRVDEVLDSERAERQTERYRATLAGERQRWSETYDDREYLVQTVPVHDDSGAVFAGMLVALDVTDRNRHESELQRQNERLQRFASVLSHDLRNPLTVATARLALAREECPDCSSTQLDRVESAHDRMMELLEDVLDLARSGRIERTEPVDLETAAKVHWEHVDTAGATLEVDSTLRFEADRSRLGQLLENLFANAVEHGSTTSHSRAGDGGIRAGSDVTVRVGSLDTVADDGPAGFYVEDDGPGIPPERAENIFELGYSTRSKGGGFGLGIVSDVATAHGWILRIAESTLGGVRFEISGVTVAESPD